MARIEIEDLTVQEEMNDEELKGIFGGLGLLLPAVQKVRDTRIKITLRPWDFKTEQTRQLTIVQDL